MREFLVCVHDAAPAYERETRAMIRDLRPLVGRRLCFGVVPDWHGAWPLREHRAYASLLSDHAEELLLHGYRHRRERGRGVVTLLAGSDEMNGLDVAETQLLLMRGQEVFTDVFGAPARGFVAPAWQRGRVRSEVADAAQLDHVLGFFSLDAVSGTTVRLSTSTWDCGRWNRLGHVGDRLGGALRMLRRGVPVLAIHPRDLESGFWPRILGLTRALLAEGYDPVTPAGLVARARC